MGTSKPNIGPKGKSSPVPPWIDDNNDRPEDDQQNDNNQNNIEEEVEELRPWADVKRAYTKFIKEPSKTSFKKLTSNYRNANGGNKTLAKSSIGGRKGAKILIQFLSSVSKNGFAEACREFNLGNLTGLTTEEAINKLCSLFEEIDGTDEGSAAQGAAVETINQLYENYEGNVDLIDNIGLEQISEYLNLYLSNYIFERLSIEVSRALENEIFTKDQVIKASDTLKDYIQGEVDLQFLENDFKVLNIKVQNAMVTEILTQAYSMI